MSGSKKTKDFISKMLVIVHYGNKRTSSKLLAQLEFLLELTLTVVPDQQKVNFQQFEFPRKQLSRKFAT